MSHKTLLAASAFFLICSVPGCRSGSTLVPLNLLVGTLEDTVTMQRTPNGDYFDVTAIVRNHDSRSAQVNTCLTPAQIEIAGVWTTVFTPNCMGGMTPLSSGDSVIVPVRVFGYTIPNKFPALDPRMVPGRYRLLFGVAINDPSFPTASDNGELKPSAPFVVK